MSKTESNVATATAAAPTTGQALEIKDTRTGTGYTVPILRRGPKATRRSARWTCGRSRTSPTSSG